MRVTLSLIVFAAGLSVSASAQDPEQRLSQQVVEPGSDVGSGALFAEPGLLRKGMERAGPLLTESGHERRTGFYPELGSMITGAGWLSVGPGYRYWFGRRAFVDGSAAISWHTYKQAQVTVEVPSLADGRLAIGSRTIWSDLTQVHYFGRGSGTAGTNSEYRIRSTDMVGYATYRVTPWLWFDGSAGWLTSPTLSAGSGWFDADYADTRSVFPQEPGTTGATGYLHGGLNVVADTRDFPGYPGRGGVYRTSWSRYADRNALLAYSFQRYEAEVAHFLPVVRDRWVLAVHGWGVFTDVAAGHNVPFYLLPSLGGGNTLRGDRNYRFHDNDLLLVSAESRFGIFEHLDATLFVDAGNVAPKLSALNLDNRSYGVGVRLHTRTSTLARFDVAHGAEQGWRFMLKLNDPFRMNRIARRGAAMPFVP